MFSHYSNLWSPIPSQSLVPGPFLWGTPATGPMSLHSFWSHILSSLELAPGIWDTLTPGPGTLPPEEDRLRHGQYASCNFPQEAFLVFKHHLRISNRLNHIPLLRKCKIIYFSYFVLPNKAQTGWFESKVFFFSF